MHHMETREFGRLISGTIRLLNTSGVGLGNGAAPIAILANINDQV